MFLCCVDIGVGGSECGGGGGAIQEGSVLQVNSHINSPESLEGPSGVFTSPLPRGETFNFSNSEGLIYEAEEVRRCLLEGEWPSVRCLFGPV